MPLNAIAIPKPKKLQTMSFKTSFHPGSVKVTHHFNNGASREFRFHDPAKATLHIRRALSKEWMHPEQNVGKSVDENLNL